MNNAPGIPNHLWNLPDSVLQSEFPEIWDKKKKLRYKNAHFDQIITDQDDGEIYLKRHGSNKAERIELFKLSDLLKYPEMPEIRELDEQKIIRDWVSLADDNIFNRTNANWETIRTDFEDLWYNFKAVYNWSKQINDFLPFAIKQLDTNLSIALKDNYYPKAVVDKKLQLLEARLDNLQKRVVAAPAIGPYANPSRTDQYPTNLDVNDKIQDDNLKTEINQLYETGGKQ
ncbi:hypothetical protein DS831_04740 [Bombilactobacillus bombi]|uniref:Uncharacterized protein n=1 Tax=Bombilactobacillus bombi TaxID=1303590 RepID=A0A3R6ZYP0_9LACO|nr:hypothetical protein [Bombilactobacillus bombi]RHW51332.1 hypothetical protein DS831_04740 [Bombilactobacillus bombi]